MKFLESAYLNCCSSLSETSCSLFLSLLSLKMFNCSLIFVCLSSKVSLFSSISCRSCCSSICSRARSLERDAQDTSHARTKRRRPTGRYPHQIKVLMWCHVQKVVQRGTVHYEHITYEHIIYNINLLIKHTILFIMTPYEVSLTDRPVSPLLDVELLLGQSSLDLSLDSSSQESTV